MGLMLHGLLSAHPALWSADVQTVARGGAYGVPREVQGTYPARYPTTPYYSLLFPVIPCYSLSFLETAGINLRNGN